jgi:predicted DNA-binding protein (MmcQ/YjbR family)
LRGTVSFSPAPYLARAKWIFVSDIQLLHEEEWKEIILQSYTLIKDKLQKKVREGLGN